MPIFRASRASSLRQSSNRANATLGFSDKANLDDGAMWPTYCALTKLTSDDESRIVAVIEKAAT